MAGNGIVIIDYGSQYTQLIARRIRSMKVYSQILGPTAKKSEVFETNPKGLILSGGPSSVFGEEVPVHPDWYATCDVPVLGICYGMQLIAQKAGAVVQSSPVGEYGHTILDIQRANGLFEGVPTKLQVWMSHGDKILETPEGMETLASSKDCKVAAFAVAKDKAYGVQFHPEVRHTSHGEQILENFLFGICKCRSEWIPGNIIDEKTNEIRRIVGKGRVICAVSGGVDSSVTACLVDRAVGDKLVCVFVDNGLLRQDEAQRVVELLNRQLTAPLVVLDASKRFLDRLEGVTDPEEKRIRIGNMFIEIFEEVSRERGPFEFLAQGTLYPDRIESASTVGPSATIKSHHNVGGLPEKLDFKLIEPLSSLFKDEVREIGLALGLPREQLIRHPFPGPGLAVRVVGEITAEKLDILRKADEIFIDGLKRWNLYDMVWQAGAILLPVRSVGVMGDARTYDHVVVLRAVTSTDGMTADWAKLDNAFLQEISNRIINSVSGVNRVVYDISSKPPSTIEWE
ncbi:MAG: glutamine-hydrolyzing GMP synthase [Candidatus Latescibacterota bacterium]|nr:MAG: glutamine-hydrolyzing GMP synthase [Candidatus Latescibacterota bacterium]